MRRIIVSGVFIAVTILIVVFRDLLGYGLMQAGGQYEIIRDARPIEEVLMDPMVPDSVKQKIELIKDVRRFAIDSIGLKDSDNYTTFYDQKGEVLLWNLSACEPYEFMPKTWSFPFLGSFPYKGFFDVEEAKAERDELKKKGYDVRIRPVGGWSTLGWFTDPILSNMLDRPEGRIADLIIHELTHSTVFIRENIEFNENLASFVGQQGVILFLKSKYGKGSLKLEDYLLTEEDRYVFQNQMLTATDKLNQLYHSFDENMPDSVKYVRKHLMIDKIISSLDTLHFHNTRFYEIFSDGRPDNAYFMSFLRYHSVEDSLTWIFQNQYAGDLTKFIRGTKAYHK